MLRSVNKRLPTIVKGFASRVMAEKIAEHGSYYNAVDKGIKQKLFNRKVYGKKDVFTSVLRLFNTKKYNILTNTMISHIMENLEWMEADSFVRFLKLESDDPMMFSFGTDVKSIESLLDKGSLEEAATYIKNLQNLAIYTARYNKPHIVELSGTLSNSGIGVFANMCFVSADRTLSLRFNEVDIGTPLLGGNSFLLSRLPKGVGEYIAFTGASLDYFDAYKFGIANKKFQLGEEEQKRIELFSQSSTNFSEISLLKSTHFIKDRINKSHSKSEFYKKLGSELRERITEGENPRSVLLDLIYKDEITKHSNNHSESNINERIEKRVNDFLNDEEVSLIENRMATVEYTLLNEFEHNQQMFYDGDEEIHGPVSIDSAKLNYIFGRGSIDECIAKMQKMKEDPLVSAILNRIEELKEFERYDLAVELFNQVRRARDLDFVGAVHDEYSTAERYFNLPQSTFEPCSPKNSLLPIRDFYKMPDAVRHRLNEVPCTNVYLQKNFGETWRLHLQLQGFDVFNPNMTFDNIRSQIWKRKFDIQHQQEQKDELNTLLHNFRRRREFFGERELAIENFFNQDSTPEKINEVIASSFNREFFRNVDLISKRSETMAKVLKKRSFTRLRQKIIDLRLITSENEKLSIWNIRPIASIDEKVNENLGKRSGHETFYFNEITSNFKVNPSYKLPKGAAERYLEGSLDPRELFDIVKVEGADSTYTRHINKELRRVATPQEQENANIMTQEYLREGLWGKPKLEHDEFVRDILKQIRLSIGSISEKSKARIIGDLNHIFFGRINAQNGTFKFGFENDRFERADLPDLTQNKKRIRFENRVEAKKATTLEEILGPLTDLTDIDFSKRGSIGESNSNLKDIKGVETLLREQIKLDASLSSNLGFLFSDDHPDFIQDLVNRLREELITIAQKKIGELWISNDKMKTILPKLRGVNDVDSESKFMGEIDSYLDNNLRFEYFNFLSAHVFFRFSFMQLKRLESIFITLRRLTENAFTTDDLRSEMSKIFAVELDSPEKLTTFVRFLDMVSSTLSTTINDYESNLHFSEDLLFLKGDEALRMFIDGKSNMRNKPGHYTEFYKDFVEQDKRQEVNNSIPELRHEQARIEALKLALDNKTTENSSPEALERFKRDVKGIIGSLEKNRWLRSTWLGSLVKLEGYYKAIVEGDDTGAVQLTPKIFNDAYAELVGLQQSGEEWLSAVLEDYVENLFTIRKDAEKVLSQVELSAYDAYFGKYLTPQNLKLIAMDELENLNFKLKLISNVMGREHEIADQNSLNTDRPINMAYMLRHRIKNTQAFKHYKALSIAVAFKSSLEDRSYKSSDKFLDRLSLSRLFKSSLTSPWESSVLESSAQAQPPAPAALGDISDSRDGLQEYCNFVLRSARNSMNEKEEKVETKLREFVRRIDLYGLK